MSKYYKVIVTATEPYNVTLSKIYQVEENSLGGYSNKGVLIAQKLISDYLKKNHKKVNQKIWNKFTSKCKINFKRIIP